MSTLTAQEVLARTNLAALLTSLSGPPVGTGRGTRWPCFSPDHHDEHPSVTMFVDRKGIERWRCWSDGHAGTAIDAVMIGHNLDVSGALRWLSERAGHLPDPAVRRLPSVAVHQPLSPAVRTWAAECELRLWRPEGAGALEWLHRRGLDDDMLRANRLGYDPGANVVGRPSGLPRWRGVTVCSFDRTGELAYVQARNLDARAPSKYSNARPEHGTLPSVTFPRGAPTDGPLLVTEGVFDGLVAAQAGYRAAALTSTSSIGAAPGSAVAAIRAHAHGAPIVLALDGDTAGRAATSRLREQLGDAPVHVLRIPDGEDLTSLHAHDKDLTWHHHSESHHSPTQSASSRG